MIAGFIPIVYLSIIMNREQALIILQLPNDANQDEIRRAYRRLAKLYHPDLNSAPEAAEKFRLIKTAYDTTFKNFTIDFTFVSEEQERYTYPKYSRKASDPEYRKKAEEYKKQKAQENDSVEEEIGPIKSILNFLSYSIHIFGLIIFFLLMVDFMLPSKISHERIIGIGDIHDKDGSNTDLSLSINAVPIVKTSFHKFSPHSKALNILTMGDSLIIESSNIFDVVRKYKVRDVEFVPAFDLFRNVWLFPVCMGFLSIMGLSYRKDKTEMNVNSIFISVLLLLIYFLK